MDRPFAAPFLCPKNLSFGDGLLFRRRKTRKFKSSRRLPQPPRLVNQSESYKMPCRRASAGEALRAPTNGLQGVAEGGAAAALAAKLRGSAVSDRRLHAKTKKKHSDSVMKLGEQPCLLTTPSAPRECGPPVSSIARLPKCTRVACRTRPRA